MRNTYQELVIKTNNLEFISDFVFAFDVDAIEEKNDELIVRSDNNLDDLVFALGELKQKLNDANLNINLTYELCEKENKDWINEYKKNIKPILIDNIYIHTTWQEPKAGYVNLKIDPALAFGSGHHESTNSCVEFLQKYYKGCKTGLDVGCGSGILSLVMANYGISVDSCDTDELAIMSTKNNFELNNLKINNIWQGSCDKAKKKYDLVVANIVADVILIIKNDLIKSLNENGVLILSGILNTYSERIKSQFSSLTLVDEKIKGDWLTLVYKVKNE
ncbi:MULTISPECIES: 50S ribosomal protein L11 methyltransferase [unclassified Campylobacter]|uniref:50S ribosomal protein L11 methyltransferase n=1 Tax=unclassified Campylobacter TaxID=2593542 RepID=UPI001BD95AE8|nr:MULTISPECIES: 50S ribosomal protein L11 methyltransferase [unclassified Campylobacter]MBT0881005.1 50S ribosomal protein L11 methyltransferase [Campylobacter sp. 2018MI27]MBT0883914.1 50S ribosomal protein L11 methyltransferase [Campylobacter sp. 2018MI10]